jgi:predicted phosphodiesterase
LEIRRLRLGVISDIHGNLEALEMAFRRLEDMGAERFVCLGDVIGYNASPKECLDLVRERCEAVVQGNHERMVLGKDLDIVHPSTRAAILWTRKQLTDDDIEWVELLPEQALVGEGVLLVHGAPRHTDEYILTARGMKENYILTCEQFPGVRACFFGHTHLPMVACPPEAHVQFHETREVPLAADALAMVNPGSVGQPRDGCPLSSFALYDDEACTVTIVRSPYAIVRAQQKVRDAGLNERLARRLALGR